MRRPRASEDDARERFFAFLARWFADLFAMSGVTDAVPLSSTVRWRDDETGLDLRVESAGRGRVVIGTIPALDIARDHGTAMEEYIRELATADRPLRPGRPPGLTTIENDEQLRKPIREMRRDRRKVTQASVAAYSGFTVPEIRGYLSVTHRRWVDFLHNF